MSHGNILVENTEVVPEVQSYDKVSLGRTLNPKLLLGVKLASVCERVNPGSLGNKLKCPWARHRTIDAHCVSYVESLQLHLSI